MSTASKAVIIPQAPNPLKGAFVCIPTELRLAILRYLILPLPEQFLTRGGSLNSDILSILLTSRQIYTEAISLLYEELTIVLEPRDISCLDTSHDGKDLSLRRAKNGVWRHHPLLDPDYRSAGVQDGYNVREMEGLMDPHIFRRFTRLSFTAEWDLTSSKLQKLMHGYSLDSTALEIFSRESTTLKLLVQLLIRSPCIRKFTFALGFDVSELSDWVIDAGEISRRALEIFMEGEILKPLEKLSNIQSFHFCFIKTEEIDPNQLPQKYLEMAQSLKQTIEANWKQSKLAGR